MQSQLPAEHNVVSGTRIASLAVGLTCAMTACSPDGAMEEWPVPDSDIWLVEMRQEESRLTLLDPVNVTRREGYDNQPSFLPDGSGFLYTTIRDDWQADTWQYDIRSGALRRITASLESEYSPTVMPDGEGFSTVRAEPEGIVRLWRFPMEGRQPRVILRDITGVAYHTWVDPESVALAIARGGERLILELVDLESGRESVLARDIGRCLHRYPGGRLLAYIDKGNPDAWLIRILDLDGGGFRGSIAARDGAEDFLVLPDGAIVMAEGRQLYIHRQGATDWELLADYSAVLDGQITRLAASPDGRHAALVVESS